MTAHTARARAGGADRRRATPSSTFRSLALPPLAALAWILAPAVPGVPGGPGAGPLAAQAPDTLRQDTVYEIEPIAVRAVRPSATAGGVSALEVRLDSVRFRPVPLLEDVLRELPLVQVRTNSRGEAQLALRGAEERQIAILLDGVPLTMGWDHRTDLSVIPMTAAQRIRLVRGMSSVLHGPNVLGGVVEIDMGATPPARIEPLRISGGVDDQGGYSLGAVAAAGVRGEAGELVVRGGIGRRERDGVAAPDADDVVYPALAGGELRVNSDLEHTDGFFSARLAPSYGGWMAATVSGFTAERGVPPELNDDGPRLWRYPEVDRAVTVLSGGTDEWENGLGTGALEASIGVDVGSTLIHDFQQPASAADPALDADAFFTTLAETESSEDRTITARVTGSQGIGAVRVAAAVTAADIRHDERITTGLADGAGTVTTGRYNQRLWSVAGEAELPLDLALGPFSGGRISGGLAWDGADTPEGGPDAPGGGPTMTAWGGRLGASLSTGGAGLLVHAAVSRRGRFPALREMYSSALGRFHPNPDLRPEVLTAVEGGFTSRFDGYDLQVVGFHQRLDGAIARGAPPAGSDARYMRINRDEVRSTGVELLAGYTLGRATLETELTLQTVEVVSPEGLAVRAEYEPGIAGGVGGTMPLFAGIEAGAEIEYWGEQYCSTPSPGQEDFATLEPSTRTDVQLARAFRLPGVASFQRLGLELAVDNVAGTTAYDQCGLPQPGRTLRLQVRLN